MSTLPLFERPAIGATVSPTLRPYQERAKRLLRMHIEQGKTRILCVAPTGSGKMVQVADIIRSSSLPTLFVAHRMELIDQCAEQLALVGITNIGVMRGADERSDPHASVQVASIQTLMRRDRPKAGLILIDEAHRSSSDSYVEHIFEAYPDSIIIGFTATPCRLNGTPLGDCYQVLEVVVTYGELLKHPEWLALPDLYSAPLAVDLSKIHAAHGDYDESELGAAMNKKELTGKLVEHYLRLGHLHPVFDKKTGMRAPGKFTEGDRRRGFLFATTIDHSLSVCEDFERAGVRIIHIDCKTSEDVRRAAVRDLFTGAIELISNCNVLLEGVDAPPAKCVVHARPTKSLTLWRQSTGRILRPWNSVVPLILDHAGNLLEHGPPHEDLNWSLTGRPHRRTSSPAMKICKVCFAYVEAHKLACPHCGAPFAPNEKGREDPRQNEQKLEQYNSDPDKIRRAFFDKKLAEARARGFKPGFPSAMFKDRYGRWPPYSWSQEAQVEFMKDPNWQANRQRAQERREQRERERAIEDTPGITVDRHDEHARMISKEAWLEAVGAPDIGPDPDPVEDDETFGDWLDEQGVK